MFTLYSALKPFYVKFLQRGQSYGLSPHEIHEAAINLFIKFLGIIIFAPWEKQNNETEESKSDTRKVRMLIHEILFQKDVLSPKINSDKKPDILKEVLKLSHLETQFKDSLSSDEWDELVSILLNQEWTLEENFGDPQKSDNEFTPEFLSYFYENVLNDFENFFSLTPKITKRKHKGVFYTPWRIIRGITERCFNQYEVFHPQIFQDTSMSIRILDPSCGTGSFLVYAAESLFQRTRNNFDSNSELSQLIIMNCIYGIDLSPSSLTVAKIRLLFWILNLNFEVVNSLPSWIFRNICSGNSLLGLCKERIQYPLDYSTALTRIATHLKLYNIEDQQISLKENWLVISLKSKEAKKKVFSEKSYQLTHQRAEKELNSLVNIFYYNWLRHRLQAYPRPAPIKERDLNIVHPFHWGIAFPEVLLEGGFDLVLGNPPYGRSVLSKTEKSMMKLIYKACSGKNPKKYSLNAVSAFIERSINLLRSKGILGLIVPFSILRVEEFEALREFILERTIIWNIDDESAAFTDVTLEMCSIFLTKQIESDYEVTISPRPKVVAESSVPIRIFKKYNRFMIYYNNLWDKTASQGLVQNNIILGDYGIDHRILKKDLSSTHSPKYPIRYLHSGRCVAKFALNPKYFQWSKPHPTNERFTKYFREPRLINTAIGNRFRVAYKPEKIVPGTNVSILEIKNSKYHFLPMLILLNSDLINYLLKRYILNFSHLTVYLHKYYTKLIPIKYPQEFEKEFEILASYLIFLNQAHLCEKLARDKRVDYLLNLSNYLVYDLYFPEILGISSNLALTVGKFLKPIDVNSFLDMVLFHEDETNTETLTRLIDENWKILRQVTHRIRDDLEIRQYKKTIFNHKIVRQIRNEL
ncbi:MAG: N-6 DNA methylase [Candidatus Heimdallarchaeota archaeon]|nr:MAG: N-6 DNA methylase [Candidatus Heimdallarchaeota archaeon]